MTDPRAHCLAGKTAVLTGASSGLGRHLAEVLADAGATVVAAARRADRLSELAARRESISPFVCDVNDDDSLVALVDFAAEQGSDSGRIDILINNAGVSAQQPSELADIATFRSVLEVNLVAAFRLTQLVAEPMLRAGAGSIVNVASIFGLVASAPIMQAAYCASKGGLISLTRHLAVEWAGRGVRANVIAPGFFHTELTAGLFADDGGTRWLERNTPMGRPGHPGELDGAVLLLASDAGSYITGQTIVVDGGWTAR